MPWPFGPSPKRVREDIGRLGGWLKKYAEGRIEDLRSPADDLNRAVLGARDPAARAELENLVFGVIGGVNPASRASKAVSKAASNLAETGYASGVPPQGVVMPKGRAGKMNTVAAVKAAQAHYGRKAVEARAQAEIARRGAAGNVDMEKAAIEQAARDMAAEIPRKAPKPPPVKTPAVMLPGDRIFTTPNSTHAGIVRELSKRKDIDPEDLAAAVNDMDNFFGFLDGKRNFLKRNEAGQRRVARGEPSAHGPDDFDSFELPNILRDFGGPAIVKEVNPLKVGTLAKQLLKTIQDNRAGFSVKLAGKELQPATTGYAVGAGGVNKNTLTVPLDKLNLRQLTQWMKANPDAWRKGVLGGWVDDAGNAVIEPSTLVDDLAAATKLGRERGEQAVGDLAKYARGEDGTISLMTAPPTISVPLGPGIVEVLQLDDPGTLQHFGVSLQNKGKRVVVTGTPEALERLKTAAHHARNYGDSRYARIGATAGKTLETWLNKHKP